MQYKTTTINGEPKLEPVNPTRTLNINAYSVFTPEDIEENNRIYHEFAAANPPIPYIGPAIPDGTILDESEVEIYTEISTYTGNNTWRDWTRYISSDPYTPHRYRRVATLKAKEPERGYTITSVKPLSEITDDDLKQIAIATGYPTDLKESTLIGLGRSVIEVFKSEGIYHISVPAYQYLQHRGYELPRYYPQPVKEDALKFELSRIHNRVIQFRDEDSFIDWFNQQGYSLTKK